VRRVAPVERGVMMPRSVVESGETRSLWESTTLTTTADQTFASACLGCPDQRCARFTEAELGRETRVESPFAPDPAVCPTNAINRSDDGVMVVNEDGCIGCGLCAIRCPVGAIHLDVETAVARVEPPGLAHYVRRVLTPDEFEVHRTTIANMTPPEVAPFRDASGVHTQIRRAASMVEGAAGQRVLRLLTRNAFLLSGAAARLKNVGDNTAAAELLVDAGGDLLVVEVEPSTDVPDAVRRAVAGSAIAVARLGADLSEVSAAVVVPRLPNERVEYYRVAQNVYDRLGLVVYGVPLALLLLAIRAGGGELGNTLGHFCYVNGSVDVAAVRETFGHPGDPAPLGLIPPK
jgi:NAD-dependent dihydropyrimidine dehydrogenase PreA subunit